MIAVPSYVALDPIKGSAIAELTGGSLSWESHVTSRRMPSPSSVGGEGQHLSGGHLGSAVG